MDSREQLARDREWAASATTASWGDRAFASAGWLRCDTERRAETVTLRVAGELDLATVPLFQSACESLPEDVSLIVLDLSSLEFIDSSGLRAVMAALRAAEGAAVRLEIVPGPAAVQRVFEITGLSNRLPFRVH